MMCTQYSDSKKIKSLRKQLTQIQNDEPNTIRAEVADYALDYWSGNPEEFFHELMNCGASSGFINGLIYYVDTHTFYDHYYDEIEELRENYEQSVGEPIRIVGDLKNFFAWFSFEETAYYIAIGDLELEL